MKTRRRLTPARLGWLPIAAFWVLHGATGALIVFGRDILAYMLASSAHERMTSLDRVFARAARGTGAPISRVETFGLNPALFLAYHAKPGERTLVIDGRSAAILNDRDPQAVLPRSGSTWP